MIEKSQFIELFSQIVECDEDSVLMEAPLHTIQLWDSLSVLNFIALVDEQFGVLLDATKLEEAETVSDLYQSILQS